MDTKELTTDPEDVRKERSTRPPRSRMALQTDAGRDAASDFDATSLRVPDLPPCRDREPLELPERRECRAPREPAPVRHLRAVRLRGVPAGLRHPLGLRLPLPRVREGVRASSVHSGSLTLSRTAVVRPRKNWHTALSKGHTLPHRATSCPLINLCRIRGLTFVCNLRGTGTPIAMSNRSERPTHSLWLIQPIPIPADQACPP